MLLLWVPLASFPFHSVLAVIVQQILDSRTRSTVVCASWTASSCSFLHSDLDETRSSPENSCVCHPTSPSCLSCTIVVRSHVPMDSFASILFACHPRSHHYCHIPNDDCTLCVVKSFSSFPAVLAPWAYNDALFHIFQNDERLAWYKRELLFMISFVVVLFVSDQLFWLCDNSKRDLQLRSCEFQLLFQHWYRVRFRGFAPKNFQERVRSNTML